MKRRLICLWPHKEPRALWTFAAPSHLQASHPSSSSPHPRVLGADSLVSLRECFRRVPGLGAALFFPDYSTLLRLQNEVWEEIPKENTPIFPPSSHITTLTRAHGPILQQDVNHFLERVLILSSPSLRLYFSLCSHSCRLLWSILSLSYGFRDASWRPGHLSHLPSISHNMKRMFPTFRWSFSTTVHLQ